MEAIMLFIGLTIFTFGGFCLGLYVRDRQRAKIDHEKFMRECDEKHQKYLEDRYWELYHRLNHVEEFIVKCDLQPIDSEPFKRWEPKKKT